MVLTSADASDDQRATAAAAAAAIFSSFEPYLTS